MKVNFDMEKWNKWLPVTEIVSPFYIDTILNDIKSLDITLKSKTQKKSIVIIFEGDMYSQRVIQKKYFLKTIKLLKKHYDDTLFDGWPLFTVEHSNYLKWVEEESYGFYERDNKNFKMNHYVFLGSNLVFEMVTPEVPKVIIKDGL